MTGNLLLDSFQEARARKTQKKSKPVVLTIRQVPSRKGEFVVYLYFPTTGLVSCPASSSQEDLPEINALGHDGIDEADSILTGIAVTAEVQIAGQACRIHIDDLCMFANQTEEERTRILSKYADSLAVRMVHARKCAIFHSVKRRLVLRLLLASRSRPEQASCNCFQLIRASGEPELECELGA